MSADTPQEAPRNATAPEQPWTPAAAMEPLPPLAPPPVEPRQRPESPPLAGGSTSRSAGAGARGILLIILALAVIAIAIVLAVHR